MRARFRLADYVALTFVTIVVVSLAITLGCGEKPAQTVERTTAQEDPPAPREDEAPPAKPKEPPPAPRSPVEFQRHKTACMNNLKNLVGLLEVTGTEYPNYRGPNLPLYLVARGELAGERHLQILFCPGDRHEDLELAGGVDAYKGIELGRDEYDHMTSYAGRDQTDVSCVARKGAAKQFVLLCDDSMDHHDGRGFVVALTGGAVKWRDKVDDWKLDANTGVEVGPDSEVAELRCLRTN